MKNEQTPDGELGWDSDEIAIGDLSCAEVAKFLSAYISGVRSMLNEHGRSGPIGCLKLARRMIDTQLLIIESKQLPEKDQKYAEANAHIGLMTLGMAMAASQTNTDPVVIGEMADKAMECFLTLVDKKGSQQMANSHVHFRVRKGKVDEEGQSFIVAVETIPYDSIGKILNTKAGAVVTMAYEVSKQGKASN